MASKKLTLVLNDEDLKKLDEVAEKEYRNVDRTKALRWLIQDAWERGNVVSNKGEVE